MPCVLPTLHGIVEIIGALPDMEPWNSRFIVRFFGALVRYFGLKDIQFPLLSAHTTNYHSNLSTLKVPNDRGSCIIAILSQW
jgi:hypothetical protein